MSWADFVEEAQILHKKFIFYLKIFINVFFFNAYNLATYLHHRACLRLIQRSLVAPRILLLYSTHLADEFQCILRFKANEKQQIFQLYFNRRCPKLVGQSLNWISMSCNKYSTTTTIIILTAKWSNFWLYICMYVCCANKQNCTTNDFVLQKKTKIFSKKHRYQAACHTTDFMTNVFYELSEKVLKMI